ncbi:MAG: hypothetical protein ACK50Q_08530 [Labrys sp. (in: a-proteobacteria)]|jgi:anti-sigma factor RsiW
MTAPSVTDEDLVALIDRRVPAAREEAIRAALASDADLAKRFALFKSTDLPFAEAFRPMLDATPADLIRSIERQIAAQATPAPIRPAATDTGSGGSLGTWIADLWGMVTRPASFVAGSALGAAAMLMIVLGLAAVAPQMLGTTSRFQIADAADAFIENVAAYQSFYTKDTIAAAPLSPQQVRESLTFANERLGRSFALADTAVPGFEFRRAQVLSFEGRPVGQFVLAAANGEPLALCVMATDLADSGIHQETRHGLTITSWRRQGFIYVTAGRFDGQAMLNFAKAVEQI